MRGLAAGSINTCVTSPPYFGLRDYNVEGQIGLEATPDAYVARLVEVFREVRRVLRDDGTLWLNLGDSYARAPAKGGSGPGGKNEQRWGCGSAQQSRVKNPASKQATNRHADLDSLPRSATEGSSDGAVGRADRPGSRAGWQAKQLLGIPWRVAFALQTDGWYLRQDIIWHKPNPMPESVRDRCTKAHEYIFLLAKSERYYFDSEAIAQPVAASTVARLAQQTLDQQRGSDRVPGKTNGPMKAKPPRFGGSKYGDNDAEQYRTKSGNEYADRNGKRNRRSVWTVTTKPFKGAHFATFPPDLIEPCVLAGCPVGGTVLDPFGGAGTTGLVAQRHDRNAILFELNPEYAAMARARIDAESPLKDLL